MKDINCGLLTIDIVQFLSGITKAQAINIFEKLESLPYGQNSQVLLDLGLRLDQAEKVSMCLSLLDRTISRKTKKINSSESIFLLPELSHLQDYHIEEIWAIFLRQNNSVIQLKRISSGSSTGTICEPAIIAREALALRSKNVILVHNHPSGNNKPSSADIELTQKVKNGLNFLELKLLDHIIFVRNDDGSKPSYFSFMDEGIL